MTAVEVEGLSKSFSDVTALHQITVQVQEGELFGFIGPDGAGKTTLFRILVTLLTPDQGTARVLGRDVVAELWDLRRRVGYMPGRFSLYGDLTVEENLEFFATAFGTTVAAQYDVIAPIYGQIEPFRRRRASDLSGGMKQKLALSCALVHRPEILFLDEPSTGVDAVSRREFWDLLDGFVAGGMTVVVSTPYMDEAVRCHRVALMQDGRLLEVDAPDGITARYPYPLLAVEGPERLRLLQTLRRYPEAVSVQPFGADLHLALAPQGPPLEARARTVTDWLVAEGLADVRVRPANAGIEDAFIHLMGDPRS